MQWNSPSKGGEALFGRRVASWLAGLAWLWVIGGSAWAASVTAVKVQDQGTATRLVLELSEPAEHKVFMMTDPERLVVDLSSSRLRTDLSKIDSRHGILRVRSGKRDQGGLRVVFDLAERMSSRSSLLRPEGRQGHRLVIDLTPANQRSAPRTVETVAEPQKPRNIVVMIDPGHGGQDPGALGPNGLREKDVVLQIAREIQARLKQQDGYEARLTRSGDYFIPLRKRTRVAREQGADLLVSIHADAYTNTSANGASVYALSKKGATSETAKWLADRENQSDLIGGVGGVTLDDKDQVLAGVLLDLSMTASMQASIDVGDRILRAMSRVNRLHKQRVEKAGFVVLKSPDIPSVLVETGFISNPEEARKLGRSEHQRKIAQSVVDGIVAYFETTPPPGTLVALRRQKGPGALTYRATRGDTLSGIAARNNISLSQLMQANGLTRETVYEGQVLLIPAS